MNLNLRKFKKLSVSSLCSLKNSLDSNENEYPHGKNKDNEEFDINSK